MEFEVEEAFYKEINSCTTVLFPVLLDRSLMESTMSWAEHLRWTHDIPDFTRWQQDTYQNALASLFHKLLPDHPLIHGQ